MRISIRALDLVALALALAALPLAGSTACGADDPRVRVLAAASLTEVIEALAERSPAPRPVVSFGPSSGLARQIRDGAPADVFVSASPDWIAYLADAGRLEGEPIVLARNRLVAIAPAGSTLSAHDPQTLLRGLEPAQRVAVADEGVPAGEVARASLQRLGLLDAYRAHLVGQKDVRAVLHAVERGEVAAGFVYATDAAVADVVRLFDFDASTHPAIEYQAAMLHDARHPDGARAFLRYLQGEAARAVLADAGFLAP